MKKILTLTLILFFILPLFASAQRATPDLSNSPQILDYKPITRVRPSEKVVGAFTLFDQSGKHLLKEGGSTGPKGTEIIRQAQANDLLILTDESKPSVKNYTQDMIDKGMIRVECKLNSIPISLPGQRDFFGLPLHMPGQVWICTYFKNNIKYPPILISEYDQNNFIKLAFYDLKNTNGKGLMFNPKTNTLILPPQSSPLFHIAVLAQQIKDGYVLMPSGDPLPYNVLNLRRRGGEPYMVYSFGRERHHNEAGVNIEIPKGVMTPETELPGTLPAGISASLLMPETPISGSPTAGAVPDSGGFTGGNSSPITPRTMSDIFHGNIPFSGGFSIFLPNLINFQWGNEDVIRAHVLSNGNALVFPVTIYSVPFAITITDLNKDHIYEAHIIRYEFGDIGFAISGKKKILKPVKEYGSYKDFIDDLKKIQNLQKGDKDIEIRKKR